MNEDQKCECRKNCHRHRWPIKVLAIVLIFWVCVKIGNRNVKASHYIGETNGPATITVSGTGDIVATPDVATFDFTVTNEAASVADAQTQTTSKMNSISDFSRKTILPMPIFKRPITVSTLSTSIKILLVPCMVRRIRYLRPFRVV